MGEERVATAAKSLTGMQFVMQDMIFLEGLLSSLRWVYASSTPTRIFFGTPAATL